MDPTFLPATWLAELVRSGQVGALELLDHYVGRVERLGPRINAVVVRDFDRARERARALDRQADKSGALFGVPMTVKESIHVAGLPTTVGHPERAERLVPVSSVAVRRLEAAGAVIFGKTNLPVDLADWQSYNPVYGTTSNPWDVARTPGGSSGGSAAAVAAGLTGFETGSDTAGSLREPAHFCGVYSHKPTHGLVPVYAGPGVSLAAGPDLSVAGPIGRSARDLAVGLDLLGRPDPDESGVTFTLPAPAFSGLKGLRVAVWAEQAGQATEGEISAALLALADGLEREGAVVGRAARPGFDAHDAGALFVHLLGAMLSFGLTDEAAAGAGRHADGLAATDLSVNAVMARMANVSHRAWLGLNEKRFQWRRAWSAFFRDWDVLLCPAFGTAALPHRQDGDPFRRRINVAGREIDYNELMFWPGLTGAFHLPATVVPIGMTASGLPVGAQSVGPLFGDRITITAAGLLEQAWLGFKPPPGW